MARVRALIFDYSGRILLGKNRDIGQYLLPGGGIDEGEHPADAVVREIREETNLTNLDHVEFLFAQDGGGETDYIFLVFLEDAPVLPSSIKDRDKEFSNLQFFDLNALPHDINPFTAKTISKYLSMVDTGVATGGVIEVFVDSKKVYELRDDTIWETLPRLAQERARGKKISFRQVLDDGTVIEQTPEPMPV